MSINNVDINTRMTLNSHIEKLEESLNSDILYYYGVIDIGITKLFRKVVEELKEHSKRKKISILLTTGGGSAETVEKFVFMLRKHYDEVDFYVPDYAMSAGTIFCMSGDNIFMDYSSVLGPIDPQVPKVQPDGSFKYVPALGYLDKVRELIDKAQKNTLSEAEFLILKDFDLAELRSYEQASDLAKSLLKDRLVKYKFKHWKDHSSTGKKVTNEEKKEVAKGIADALGDHNRRHTHSRPIDIKCLSKIGLKIEDYTEKKQLRKDIREYSDLLIDYATRSRFHVFIHTKHHF